MLRDDEYYRAPLLWLLIPHGVGLACAWAGVRTPITIGALAAVILAGVAVWVSFREVRFAHLAWGLLVASAAFLGGAVRMQRAMEERPRWRQLPPREVTVETEISRVFSSAAASDRIACIARVTDAPVHIGDLVGQRVFVSLDKEPGQPDVLKTTRLRIKGVLESIASTEPEHGSFESYLLSIAVPFRLSRTRILETTRQPGWLPRFWNRIGGRFAEILSHGLPGHHPGAAAYAAMMLGRKSELSGEQREVFLHSGTMHLFAISGLHIGVIALGLSSVLSVCRVPRKPAFVVGILLLIVFVESTGGTPSERRALMMVGFLWAGTVLQKPSNPLASLTASALVVLLLDPLALLSTSFQLSYSVVAAILLYGAALKNRIHARLVLFRDVPIDEWRWWQHGLNGTLRTTATLFCVSLSAMLVSAPLGLDAFGVTAPVALLTNVLIMPMAGLAISAGFASLMVGFAGLLPLSTIFNHAAVMVIQCIAWLAQLASSLPFSHFDGGFVYPWIAPSLVSGVLFFGLAGYARGWHRMPGGLLTAPVVVAALMVLLVR